MTTYPHIPETWLDAFVGQSRLLGYSGAAIGAALADVDDFSAQSGETPDEAFGEPRAYAMLLDLPKRRLNLWPTAVATMYGMIGFKFTLQAVGWAVDMSDTRPRFR